MTSWGVPPPSERVVWTWTAPATGRRWPAGNTPVTEKGRERKARKRNSALVATIAAAIHLSQGGNRPLRVAFKGAEPSLPLVYLRGRADSGLESLACIGISHVRETLAARAVPGSGYGDEVDRRRRESERPGRDRRAPPLTPTGVPTPPQHGPVHLSETAQAARRPD